MGAYKYLQEIWRKKQSDVMRYLFRVRTWEYRQLPAIHRAPRPTRPEKARKLGYKAINGICVYRVRIRKGDRKRQVRKGITYGKPKHQGIRSMKSTLSLKAVAEKRVGKKLGGLRVMNSYWVGQDGTYKYFEVILVDPMSTHIRNDYRYNWICKRSQKHRECRGVTLAGRKSRGLLNKGRGTEHIRPSKTAAWKRRKSISLRRFR